MDLVEELEVRVESEVDTLEAVIVHSPGPEIEGMTPENAERALYSDILNLAVATQEYAELRGVLARHARVLEVRQLLSDVLHDAAVKGALVRHICGNEQVTHLVDELCALDPPELVRCLFEGVPLRRDNLTRFLSHERYALRPLHNFFYTRDAAITVGTHVIVGCMASRVREREALIMRTIFDSHPRLRARTVDLGAAGVTLEGGDVLVVRRDILLIGVGARTTTQAVDRLLEWMGTERLTMHVLVQELPLRPESFIHLDMVFTMVDVDTCMIYEPVVLGSASLHTIDIFVEKGEVRAIREVPDLLAGLADLGVSLKPVRCGSDDDPWIAEREQWHSGANLFALGPGKVVTYRRNAHTVQQLERAGFQVLAARDVIDGTASTAGKRCVVTVDGDELARGGGGCRCMTMPVRRGTDAGH